MQRDMDLVRMILLRLECLPTDFETTGLDAIGYTPESTKHHLHIMKQEGLIEAQWESNLEFEGSHGSGWESGSGPEDAALPVLTWQGHEFLDLARDQARWNRARAIIAKVGGAPIAIWKKVLTDLAMKHVDMVSA